MAAAVLLLLVSAVPSRVLAASVSHARMLDSDHSDHAGSVRWEYISLPDWHIEAMSIFLLREVQTHACPGSTRPACELIRGALPQSVTRAKRRRVETPGQPTMAYRIDVVTSRGIVIYTVLEQGYSHSMKLEQASVHRPAGTLASMVGKESLDVLREPLELDASAFATLQAAGPRERAESAKKGGGNPGWGPDADSGVFDIGSATKADEDGSKCLHIGVKPVGTLDCTRKLAPVCAGLVTYGNRCLARAACEREADIGEGACAQTRLGADDAHAASTPASSSQVVIGVSAGMAAGLLVGAAFLFAISRMRRRACDASAHY